MKNRIISAIIMLAIFIPVLIVGENVFAFLVCLLSILGLKELLDLKNKGKKIPLLIRIISYITVIYLVINNYLSDSIFVSIDSRLLGILLFVFLIPSVIMSKSDEYSFNVGMYALGSVLLIGLPFGIIAGLRNYSLEMIIYLFLITVITDTFALVTGKLIGRNKMCPKISPNKTVEGLIGGTLMGTYVPVMFYLTFVNPDIDLLRLIIVTISLSLVGQLGDLIFSSIKRQYDIKDFSNLIPGHGGILDRFDSMIFVLLAFVLFIGII